MMSWLNRKLFRKPLLLKIFPKYISTFFSRVRQHCWGKLYIAVWKGFETNLAELLTDLQFFLFLESSPSSPD